MRTDRQQGRRGKRQIQHARTADWLWQSQQRGVGAFTGGYPSSATTEGLYTPAACWNDRIASREGIMDPRSCVACSSECAGGRRPPHREELASICGLPTNEPGQGWAALRSTVQFADLLQRNVPGPGPTSYLSHNRRLQLFRAHGTCPREEPNSSSFLLCSPFCDALGLPQEAYLDFPRSREWEVAVGPLPHAVRRARDPITACPAPITKPTRLCIGPHVQ